MLTVSRDNFSKKAGHWNASKLQFALNLADTKSLFTPLQNEGRLSSSSEAGRSPGSTYFTLLSIFMMTGFKVAHFDLETLTRNVSLRPLPNNTSMQ